MEPDRWHDQRVVPTIESMPSLTAAIPVAGTERAIRSDEVGVFPWQSSLAGWIESAISSTLATPGMTVADDRLQHVLFEAGPASVLMFSGSRSCVAVPFPNSDPATPSRTEPDA